MILTQILRDNAKKYPNKTAVTMRTGFRNTTMTYKEMYDIAKQIAHLLEKEGIEKGDKVLLLAPNSPYWICCFWAILLRGAVAVPLNVQSMPEMVEKIARQTGAKLFFAHRYYKGGNIDGIKRYDVDVIKYFLDDDFEYNDVESAKPDDLVQILYTSGTTGDPKGVMLTHANLFSNIKAVSKMTQLRFGKERLLSILPLSHIFEQAIGFLLAQHYAAHVIYAHSHAAIGDLLKEYKITKMVAVPEFLKILMGKIETAAEEKGKKKVFEKLIEISFKISNKTISRLLFRSVHKKFGGKLDTVACAGAPLDQELEKKWISLGVTLLQGYGLTETSALVSGNSYEEHRFGSVGKVAPGVTVRIDGDTEGEIQVKGPNVFQGYFKNDKKTKEVFTDDGFFKTEDIGSFDKDQFLFLKGRKKYMIIGPGGQNVFPEDIEEILQELDGVEDSCVVGLEQQSGMVKIHAVFLLRDEDVDPKELVGRANEKLASYQKITGYSVWPDDDFPRSATKKIRKEEVLQFLRERASGDSAIVDGKTPLIKLVASVTGVESAKISEETKLVSDLGLDSLMRIELIARIEDDLGVLIDETEIKIDTTIEDLEKMMHEKKPIKSLPPLRKWPRFFVSKIFRFLGQKFIFLLMRTFAKIEVVGLEHLKNIKLPVVFMPNHSSYIDPFILLKALPKNIRSHISFAAANDVLYQEYRSIAPLGELFFNAFPFPRKEDENIKRGLDYMGRMLDDNYSVVVYPEGKISVDGMLQPLKKGAGLIAVEMDAFVVPVIVKGSNDILPYEKMVPRRRGVAKVVFGEPIKFSYAKSSESYDEATKKIESAMLSMTKN